MTFGTFIHGLFEWLLQKQVQDALVIILGIFNLILFAFIGTSHWRMRMRLYTIEQSYRRLFDRIVDVRSDISVIKSELKSEVNDLRFTVRRSTQEIEAENDGPGKV
ncbi:hypothetical protein KAR91_80130 [Candidatus Pacearchaeota archaeon]|nr:hypothetical protein [Candidatus Pacearchaeota archaeon]